MNITNDFFISQIKAPSGANAPTKWCNRNVTKEYITNKTIALYR